MYLSNVLTRGGMANSGLLSVCVFVQFVGSLEIRQCFTPDVHSYVCRTHLTESWEFVSYIQ